MKKGIMELADGIIVHKADGENLRLARKTAREYTQMLHFLQPSTPSWTSKAVMASSYEKTGLTDVWEMLESFKETTMNSGMFEYRRQAQTKDWFHQMIRDHLVDSFYRDETRKKRIITVEQEILSGQLTVSQGLSVIFDNENEIVE